MRSILVLGVLCGLSLPVLAARGAEATVSELATAVKSTDTTVRLAAIDALATKGAKAAEAVPALTAALEDASAPVRARAAYALGQIGDAAKPAAAALVKLVGDADPAVRRAAGDAIRRIRPGPQVTIPLFAKLMEGGDAGLRARAMNELADVGEDAVPFLIQALKSEKAAYWACLVLRDIGPKAKAAVPGLAELAADKRPEVRREAILALASMGPAAAPATPALVQALDDKLTCAAATYALGSIGKAPEAAEAVFRKNVNDPDKIVGTASIWAIAKLHADNKQYMLRATQALVKFLKDTDPRVRKAAAHALGALQPPPEIARPIFEEAFKDVDEKIVVGAMDALAGIGAPAVPRLIAALKNEGLRPRVAYILGQMGPVAAPAVNALVGLIDDKNPDTQSEALIALAKIGPAAKAAVPALLKALQEREATVGYGVVYALGKIGPDAAAAKPALLKALRSDDLSLALMSAWALAQIEPASADCAANSVPVLIRGLSDPAVEHRREAAETLGAWGALAKGAVPALKQALQDEDKAVSTAAAAALARIGN